MARTSLCECGTCSLCKQREYHRAWKKRNPDYYQRYYDDRDPARPGRREARSNQGFTPEQDALLGTMRDVDLAKLIDKTGHSVWKRRQRLGVPRYVPSGGGRRYMTSGYVIVTVERDDPLAGMGRRSDRGIPEHRLVMARALGRPLAKDESVHHRNGVRDDNRIENLELWTRSHPDGQRVTDILAWARRFVARYEAESLHPAFFDTESAL